MLGDEFFQHTDPMLLHEIFETPFSNNFFIFILFYFFKKCLSAGGTHYKNR